MISIWWWIDRLYRHRDVCSTCGYFDIRYGWAWVSDGLHVNEWTIDQGHRARMGICFCICGVYYSNSIISCQILMCSLQDLEHWSVGAIQHLSYSVLKLYLGAPISGALLSSNYTWWKPALFSGVSWLRLPYWNQLLIGLQILSLCGSMMYFALRVLVSRRKSSTELTWIYICPVLPFKLFV